MFGRSFDITSVKHANHYSRKALYFWNKFSSFASEEQQLGTVNPNFDYCPWSVVIKLLNPLS